MAVLYFRNDEGEFVEVPAICGRSAYEVAVANGFEGTETEWLASLGPVRGVDYWTEEDKQEILQDTYNAGTSTAVKAETAAKAEKIAPVFAGSSVITAGLGSLPDGIVADCLYLVIFNLLYKASYSYATGLITINSGTTEDGIHNAGSLGQWALLVRGNEVVIDNLIGDNDFINGTLNFFALSTDINFGDDSSKDDSSTDDSSTDDGSTDDGSTDVVWYSSAVSMNPQFNYYYETEPTTQSCPTLIIEVTTTGFEVYDEDGTLLDQWTYKGEYTFNGIYVDSVDPVMDWGTSTYTPGKRLEFSGGQYNRYISLRADTTISD